MRGDGTLYRQAGSRFWWMQYWREGKRFRESTGCEKFKAANDVRRQKQLQLANGAVPGSSRGLTVGDLYQALERDYSINGRKSLEDLKSRWTKHLKPVFENFPFSKLDADRIDLYKEARLKEGAANGSVNRELAALKRAFKLGLKAGKIKIIPYISMLREDNVRSGLLSDDKYQPLADATARVGLWLRAMFEVAYTCAFRKTALLDLKVGQLDLIGRTISMAPGSSTKRKPKKVFMTDKMYELLAQCCAGKGPEDYVFTRDRDRRGRKPKVSRIVDFRKDWDRACKAAGVEGLLFHDLRRTAATNMIEDGMDEKLAMSIGGWKTRSVFDRYHIVREAPLREAAKRMERGARARQQKTVQMQMFEAGGLEPSKKPAASEGQRTVIEARRERLN